MIKLNVWLTFPSGEKTICGEIVTADPNSRGQLQGAFRYTRNYLNHPSAFPLDPVHLVLSPEEFQADRREGVHGVFEDALPDAWGRGLLVRKANLPRERQTIPEMLSALGDSGLGALSFLQKERSKGEDVSATIPDLQALVDAAYQYDAGETVAEDSLRLLFRAASSPGGARPKALVVDEKGDHWIAKFPSVRDLFDMIPIEAATLRLANDAGLAVPESSIFRVGSRKILIVKRFDVTEEAGRRHMISLQTLLGAEGYYNLSYLDLFDVLRRYSDRPAIDIPLLFRQMTFNAVIGNTDDHLKNFTMLHDDRGFHLSPAYDLMPDVAGSREHVLRFDNDFTTPNRKTLLRMANRLGVSKSNEIIDGVIDSVSRWKRVFEEMGVPAEDFRRLNWGISNGMKRLTG